MTPILREVLRTIRGEQKAVTAYIMENWKVNLEVAKGAYDDIHGLIRDDMMMPESRLTDYLEGLYRREEINRMVSAAEVIDYSLLKGLR